MASAGCTTSHPGAIATPPRGYSNSSPAERHNVGFDVHLQPSDNTHTRAAMRCDAPLGPRHTPQHVGGGVHSSNNTNYSDRSADEDGDKDSATSSPTRQPPTRHHRPRHNLGRDPAVAPSRKLSRNANLAARAPEHLHTPTSSLRPPNRTVSSPALTESRNAGVSAAALRARGWASGWAAAVGMRGRAFDFPLPAAVLRALAGAPRALSGALRAHSGALWHTALLNERRVPKSKKSAKSCSSPRRGKRMIPLCGKPALPGSSGVCGEEGGRGRGTHLRS